MYHFEVDRASLCRLPIYARWPCPTFSSSTVIAFGESMPPLPAPIVIIEFKRPLRNDYDDADNFPRWRQGSVDKIWTSKVTDRHGQPLNVPASTLFTHTLFAI